MSSYLTKRSADDAGRAARKKLPHPERWSVRVWENLGWHAAVEFGGMTVYIDSPSRYDRRSRTRYYCLMSRDDAGGGGEMFWTERGAMHYCPRKAVEAQLKVCRAFVDQCNEAVAKVEEVFR